MRIAMIAAMARNRVIGKNNQMPWHMPADLKHFKSVTMGKPVIMGRKTFESIGRPLPGRKNIVITRDAQYQVEGVEVVTTPEAAIQAVPDVEEVMIIGGGQIYVHFLPMATDLHLTFIDAEPEGDAFFPELPSSFKQVSTERHLKDEKNQYSCDFTHWLRKAREL
ncbi:type 3 dihydrofolate reductase [Echinimonas agarilytica]|uniref:Dihydrofolate reductase n=1 Tax=Echinimonas agarilytica TaxID=1215918 RepID=A0AA41W914_9GAMM|nr:type 3 dihydrofolate reductase [Echinimonas agarilytica]MCM2681300.1 type 3 dihydrofolate reductase [Echinimonas agarilytica]